MIDNIKSLVVLASPEDTIDQVIRNMSSRSKKVLFPGVVLILDSENCLLGVVTDGDIRRAYADDILFSRQISQIMTRDPVTISNEVESKDIQDEVESKIRSSQRLSVDWVRYIVVVNDMGQPVDVIDYLKILKKDFEKNKKVAVFGMGYVGITLAVSLANQGHQVVGVDIDENIINNLKKGRPHILEPGISNMLTANLERQVIDFKTALDSNDETVYIIAVGTPLNKESKPDMSALLSVLNVVSKVLKPEDQVILRSTVPVGVTREFVVPFLEKESGLKAGVDFYVSFSPERTVEGDAMNELKVLPQVVGGYSSECSKCSADFWSTLTPFVVYVDTLEAAELVKLANNTYRDLTFSFANELALLSDKYNVNTFDLINAANEGYPRDKIPFPSPGVGGYCLTKDPILFSATSKGMRSDAVLGISSREVNERAALYPVEVVKKYAQRIKCKLSDVNVLIMGVAFKGVPETKDIRGSVSIDVFIEISAVVNMVLAWDAIIETNKLFDMGFEVMDNLKESILVADVILIMNNHPDNVNSDLYSLPEKDKLIFDGWNQINRLEIEKNPRLVYATMGYMTE